MNGFNPHSSRGCYTRFHISKSPPWKQKWKQSWVDIRQEKIAWPSPGQRHSYGGQLFLVCQRLLLSTLKILLAKKCPSLAHWDGWLPSGCSGCSQVSPARALSVLWGALLRKKNVSISRASNKGLMPPKDWGLCWAGSHMTCWWAVCSSFGSLCPPWEDHLMAWAFSLLCHAGHCC